MTAPVRRNLTFYLLHQASRFLFPIVLTPFLARSLGPASYADLVVWNACVWTASLLMEYGFHIYAINAVATAPTDAARADVVSTIVCAKAALTPLAFAAYLAGALLMGLAAREPVMVAVGAIAMTSYGASFAWYFQGRQQGGKAVLLEAIPPLVQFALILAFVRDPQDAWLAACLQSGAAVATVATSAWLLRAELAGVRWQADRLRRTLKAAAPFFVERLSYTLYATATPILLTFLSTRQEAAYYGLAEKVNIVLTAIIAPVTQSTLPVIAARLKRQPPDLSLSLRVISACVLATAFGAAIVLFAGGPVVERVLGAAYRPAVPVAHWFSLVAVLMVAQITISNLILIPLGRDRQFMQASLLALAVSLATQVAVVPHWGAVGSAGARAASELAILIYFLVVARSLFRRTRHDHRALELAQGELAR